MSKKTITVTSGLDNNKVALWEQHPDHPHGEIYVVGDAEVEVAETPRVFEALRDNRLIKVEDKKSSSPSSSSKSGSSK